MTRDRQLEEARALGEAAMALAQRRSAQAPEGIGQPHGAASLPAFDLAQAMRARSLPSANWRYWTHVPRAELWQCVALSFGVEPVENMKCSSMRGWFEGHHRDHLRLRLAVATQNLGDDGLATLFPLHCDDADAAKCVLGLAAFGEWARARWPSGVVSNFPRGVAARAVDVLPLPGAECTSASSPAEMIREAAAEAAEQPQAGTKSTKAKAPDRHRKNLKGLLKVVLGVDYDAGQRVPLDKGGRRNAASAKQRARAAAEAYGLTGPNFDKAWNDLKPHY